MGLPPEKTHMSRMNPDQCEDVVEWSKQLMQDLDDLDRQIGA